MHSLLFLRYVKWHFIDAPINILKGWGNIIWFVFNYFSVSILLATFFSPWRRITWSYGRGFRLGDFLFVSASNLISRILGAIMRTVLIVVGLTVDLVVLIAGIPVFLIWLVLPFLTIFVFFYGIILLL